MTKHEAGERSPAYYMERDPSGSPCHYKEGCKRRERAKERRIKKAGASVKHKNNIYNPGSLYYRRETKKMIFIYHDDEELLEAISNETHRHYYLDIPGILYHSAENMYNAIAEREIRDGQHEPCDWGN